LAIWQVPIVFIPAQWAQDNQFKADSLYDEDGFDTKVVWSQDVEIKGFKNYFNSILPVAESWNEEIDIWGNTQTNDLTIIREGNQIECIMCRLDLRDDVFSLMSSIINIALKFNCVLFVPSQRVIIEPNLFVLKKHLTQSNAAKFIKDPEVFLNSLPSEQ
jgi:hypothetical protein